MVVEQEAKYNSMQEIHQQLGIDFSDSKTRKKLQHIESLIKKVYDD